MPSLFRTKPGLLILVILVFLPGILVAAAGIEHPAVLIAADAVLVLLSWGALRLQNLKRRDVGFQTPPKIKKINLDFSWSDLYLGLCINPITAPHSHPFW